MITPPLAMIRSLAVLLLTVSIALPGRAEPMRTDDFSLHLASGARPTDGYFPMGFVRGDASATVAAGFSLVQETSMFAGAAQGEKYPAPSPYLQDSRNLRYYSLALPADSIESLMVAGARSGTGATAATKGFGAFTLAIGPDDKPYALPEFKTRDLAKVRDLVDVFDPRTRRYLQSYVRAHVDSRVKSPINDSIWLWGLDNEWEAPANYSLVARGLYLEWLKRAYGSDIAGLNAAWGTHFKGFDKKVVAALPGPADYRARPGEFLDWQAFSTDYFMHVMVEQAKAMHEADPLKRGVVHKSTQLTLEMPATRRLRLLDHGRFAEMMRPYSGGLYGIDMYGAGDRQAYETSYIYHCIRPEDRAPGYGVMLAESNNHNGPGHQFASTQWRLLANGVKAMMFFTPGFVGAPKRSDWDTFAMIDRATGQPKDKWFYAARWASAVHRTEEFWSRSVPADKLPRLALLMPSRDVLLSERSERNKSEGRYSYPRNHRWMVYRWLREQGYWVDVIPYEKLTERYLRDYAGLVLVGAEHLSASECETVARFVAGGGVLVGDTSPGYYDIHHRVLAAFVKPSGLRVARVEAPQPVGFQVGSHHVEGVSSYTVEAAGAQVLERDVGGRPLALLHGFHGGKILSLPFELGSLVLAHQDAALASVQSGHEPTAGSEQYDAHAGEFVIGEWLAGLLRQAGLSASYRADFAGSHTARLVRVEQPFVDARGNVAVVIANRAQLQPQEKIPAGQVEMPLPNGAWREGWWAPAENETLVRVAIEPLVAGLHRVALPAIDTAGILYLFRAADPLLAVENLAGQERALDGQTPRVPAGSSAVLPVALVNPAGRELAPGSLRLKAPRGWKVEPAEIETPRVPAGGKHVVEFAVTLPESGAVAPHWSQPLTARWSEGGRDRAIVTTQIEPVPDEAAVPRLLSDNAQYPATFPYRLETGATYRYLAPVTAQIKDPVSIGSSGVGGRALLTGFGSQGGERNSFNRGGYVAPRYARYATPVAEVLFDLQAMRRLARVNIVSGPEPVMLQKLAVSISEDGVIFTPVTELTPEGSAMEHELALAGLKARFVRIRAEWPFAGGTLDEVEIWGW